MAIEVGKAAPAFTLTNEKGKKVSLKDYRGQHVIVYFYPKDNTPGCTKEAQGFRKLWKKIQAHDAVVLVGLTAIGVAGLVMYFFSPQRPTGCGFWCYSENQSKSRNLWQHSGLDYNVIYTREGAPDNVSRAEAIIPSRRWEAWREGIEDWHFCW